MFWVVILGRICDETGEECVAERKATRLWAGLYNNLATRGVSLKKKKKFINKCGVRSVKVSSNRRWLLECKSFCRSRTDIRPLLERRSLFPEHFERMLGRSNGPAWLICGRAALLSRDYARGLSLILQGECH